MKKYIILAVLMCILLFAVGCDRAANADISADAESVSASEASGEPTEPAYTASADASADASGDLASGDAASSDATSQSYLVVIDPGHQSKANTEQEPIGPGATETKMKVTAGTSGVVSGLSEGELTLSVSLMLKEELEERGYTVIMTREENDVDISNSQRAQIANDASADAFIRIHANGSDDSSVSGAMTICQTASNPYNGELAEESYLLSSLVLDHLTLQTGAIKEKVWQTDTMSGVNWAQVPVTIVEVGYMTNPQEDQKMADVMYQKRIAEGIADGIDAYFAETGGTK